MYKNFIGGEWIVTDEYQENRNPANYDDILGLFPDSRPEDVNQAMEVAFTSYELWRKTNLSERAACLYRVADWLDTHAPRIAEDITREEGKIYREALQEVKRSAEHFRFYASLGYLGGGHTYPANESQLTLYSMREPLGVVAVITPWNFPLSIPARKIAAALTAGNAVVFKPASETPLTAVHLTRAIEESGIPPGVFNLVIGRGSRIGDVIVSHHRVHGVTFTGSTEAGFHIQRSVSPTCRTQLELGGKNAVVVMDDADLDQAVNLVVKGGYNLTGQACTGTSRVLVQESVYQSFLDRLIYATSNLHVGDGRKDGTDVGPLISAAQLHSVIDYIHIGIEEGLPLLFGGTIMDQGDYQKGFYVLPAVFAPVNRKSRLFQEEIFGPVLAVTPFATLEEAIDLTNDSSYGLVAAIFTQQLKAAHLFADRVQAGMIKINRTTTGLAMNAPFGGWKHSSTATFREEGIEALEFFTREKTVFMGWDL
ncbi:MAG: aldehyde dehydrogenase family protein [Sulfobacillus thermosulfidooxidans]|uniref:Aldehyde dehydrogenase family protein n=1 Tax=Sulfobacillus thermosulfidooxidans TaxID=28034 RepID=A0A2T2WQK1_SULTH|nr:MAG: aldehyde dehydrogenase family protein [Sulfobacillus thermosulfidooxidans]